MKNVISKLFKLIPLFLAAFFFQNCTGNPEGTGIGNATASYEGYYADQDK